MRKPVTSELRGRVARLLARGKTYDQIAEAIGRTKNAVAGIVYTNRNPRPDAKPLRPDLDISLVSDLPTHEARYILAVTLGLGLSETGRLVGRTPPTIAYSCRVVEDRRDDHEYDEILEAIETDKIRQARQTPEFARALQGHSAT